MSPSHDPYSAARDALRLIGPAPRNWVIDRPGVDHNVLIVGGGQTGCGLAFALSRAGIGKVSVIDAAEDESRAGIWLTAARMNLLRTPKALTGPELGITALGFQAWFEARHGTEAYAAIDRIPRVTCGPNTCPGSGNSCRSRFAIEPGCYVSSPRTGTSACTWRSKESRGQKPREKFFSATGSLEMEALRFRR